LELLTVPEEPEPVPVDGLLPTIGEGTESEVLPRSDGSNTIWCTVLS
jgi:hypothetical protein